jgi:hypothetical protein
MSAQGLEPTAGHQAAKPRQTASNLMQSLLPMHYALYQVND